MQLVIGMHPGDRGLILVLMVCIAAAAPVHPVPMQPGFWVHVGFVCLLGGVKGGVDRLDGIKAVDPFQTVLVH